jgi:tellurite resistance protein TehA-like permease
VTAAGPIAELHPAYFALVMATGIVSLACHLLGWPRLANGLFVLNLVFYPTLLVLTAIRIARYRDRVIADLVHHGRAVGFFTSVAATCIVGSECFVIARSAAAATVLFIAGTLLWATLTYTILTILTVIKTKPPLAEGLNGGWLVIVVAAQSVAVLGAQLLPTLSDSLRSPLALFCLAMWLGGGMLYIWIIGLIFYRYTFASMSPSDLAPPYWINMGAAAISTLAGAHLTLAADRAPLLKQLLPFLKGFTMMWWATASWWIPMLFVLGVWRHVFRKFPLRYDPLYWGAVFPLGMYTVATIRVSSALDSPFVMSIPRVSVYVALAAWLAAALGLAARLWGRATGRRA